MKNVLFFEFSAGRPMYHVKKKISNTKKVHFSLSFFFFSLVKIFVFIFLYQTHGFYLLVSTFIEKYVRARFNSL